LNFGTSEPPSTGKWDPDNNFGATDLQVASVTFDSLITTDRYGRMLPALGTSWHPAQNGGLEIKLRPNVRFQDGTPLTAVDVKTTIERVSRDTSLAHNSFWAPTSVKILDSHTVAVIPDTPFAPLPWVLTRQYILSHKQLADINQLQTHPIGTGPFRFDSYEGTTVSLSAHSGYWGGVPRLSGLRWQIISNRPTLIAALQSGEVDIVDRLSPPEVSTVKGTTQLSIVTDTRSLNSVLLAFDLDNAYMKDLAVRQAIAHAVDRPGIVSLFHGSAKLAGSVLPTGNTDYVPLPAYDFNPQKAKALLAKAGYSQGFTVSMPTSTGFFPLEMQVDELIAANLTAVGIDVKLLELDPGKYNNVAGTVPLQVISWYDFTDDADFALSLYAPPNSALFHYSSPTFTALMQAQRHQLNPTLRKPLITKAAELIWDDLPALPLHEPLVIFGLRAAVQGFDFSDPFALRLSRTSIT